MFRLKPFSHSTTVTYEKPSENKITILVSSNGVNKSVTASVFPKAVVKEIENVNARPRDLTNTG